MKDFYNTQFIYMGIRIFTYISTHTCMPCMYSKTYGLHSYQPKYLYVIYVYLCMYTCTYFRICALISTVEVTILVTILVIYLSLILNTCRHDFINHNIAIKKRSISYRVSFLSPHEDIFYFLSYVIIWLACILSLVFRT